MHEETLTTLIEDYERGGLSRRQLIAHVSGLLALAAGTRALGEERAPSTFRAIDVNHVALRVTDVERSAAFYERHLGLSVTSRSSTSCFLRCNERDFLALFRGDAPRMDHYCFAVEGYSAESAVARLEAAGLGPRREGERVYFDDPDGIEVQVASASHGP